MFRFVIALRVSVIARHEAIQVKALSYGLLRRLAMTLHVYVILNEVEESDRDVSTSLRFAQHDRDHALLGMTVKASNVQSLNTTLVSVGALVE